MSAFDIVFAWHDLPLSAQRKIAAQFGIPPCGATSRHLWTMQIVEAASGRGELDKLKAAISEVVARETPTGPDLDRQPERVKPNKTHTRRMEKPNCG